MFLRISSPASTCFTTIKSKKVHFSKFSQKKSIKDDKMHTYLKWNTKTPQSVPTRTKPDGTVKFSDKEEIEFYEEWSRHQALKLWNELHPRNKLKDEDFFVGIDLDLLKPDDKISQAKGDLQQQITHTERLDAKVDSNKNPQSSPKTAKKTKSEPTSPEKLRSALKGKQKIFYLESKSGRNYIVDSGASFHLVSRDELTDQEKSTIIALDEPIPIQTANGEVELNEKCQIFVRDPKVRVWAHILPDTVAVLSLGLLVEEL